MTELSTPCSTTIDSPLGPIVVVADDNALRAVRFVGEPIARAVPVADVASHPVLGRTIEQLDEYFAGGRRDFDLPLGAEGTSFQRSVWHTLCTIPFGATISYGEQARRLGDARKARAVGGANGRNPIPIVVPCHRVIGADGSLTGFAAGVEIKRWLIDHEQRVLARG
jgi:methylated-DNA-[protein]-cysteine S-methyltransferase